MTSRDENHCLSTGHFASQSSDLTCHCLPTRGTSPTLEEDYRKSSQLQGGARGNNSELTTVNVRSPSTRPAQLSGNPRIQARVNCVEFAPMIEASLEFLFTVRVAFLILLQRACYPVCWSFNFTPQARVIKRSNKPQVVKTLTTGQLGSVWHCPVSNTSEGFQQIAPGWDTRVFKLGVNAQSKEITADDRRIWPGGGNLGKPKNKKKRGYHTKTGRGAQLLMRPINKINTGIPSKVKVEMPNPLRDLLTQKNSLRRPERTSLCEFHYRSGQALLPGFCPTHG
ncbi:hypothetical protein RRG08_020848 [Elysia crispata]|uniref:Uncharacterized protein n=1 Tax=Elysia crispata TaxID=231223 RepID=A0AAE1CMT9_9GAST|nr:hypothetical protein RRG08_020848 [Elysia crispata]